MSKRREITISPTTRIEGHGKVTITLDPKGNVSEAHFHATEIRGFEYFMRGMEAEKVPFIISRICGVCSTAHVMASVKAIENVYHVEITETARKLRELLLMGQVIGNHSTSFFFLTLPDFWFPLEEDPSRRNIFQVMRQHPDIGRKAIKLRTFGTNILTLIGSREVHIVSVIPGGLIKPLDDRRREVLLEEAREACAIAREAVQLGKELFEKNWTEFSKTGDCKTCYMGLVNDGVLDFHQGRVRLINPKGDREAELDQRDYMDHIKERAHRWTFARSVYFEKLGWPRGITQVGPIARMNVSNKISTETANKELREFKRKFGHPAHTTLLFDYARLIELLYACERARQLLEYGEITGADTRQRIRPRPGEGMGIVEAPRGTLAHRYVLTRSGKLKAMRLMIPTEVNNAAINMSVKAAASRFIHKHEVRPGLLNGIEMLIRAYDPCIKCATRMAGDRVTIEIRDQGGKIVKKFR